MSHAVAPLTCQVCKPGMHWHTQYAAARFHNGVTAMARFAHRVQVLLSCIVGCDGGGGRQLLCSGCFQHSQRLLGLLSSDLLACGTFCLQDSCVGLNAAVNWPLSQQEAGSGVPGPQVLSLATCLPPMSQAPLIIVVCVAGFRVQPVFRV